MGVWVTLPKASSCFNVGRFLAVLPSTKLRCPHGRHRMGIYDNLSDHGSDESSVESVER